MRVEVWTPPPGTRAFALRVELCWAGAHMGTTFHHPSAHFAPHLQPRPQPPTPTSSPRPRPGPRPAPSAPTQTQTQTPNPPTRYLKELDLPELQVVKEIDSGAMLSQIVLTQAEHLLFAGTAAEGQPGMLRAYTFPLSGEYLE